MRTIKMNLSPDSIQQAINDLNAYKNNLQNKCRLFCQRMTEAGLEVAQSNISKSPLGNTITVDCNLSEEETGCKGILFAVGETVTSKYYEDRPFNTLLAVEFGAGILYNPTPNPLSEEFGMGVGTFPGQVYAFQNTWYFKGEDGKWHPAHGVKAEMPMYHASEEMKNKISSIAKTVFESK